jgi:iron complex outermembrane receptor protein
VSARSAFGTTPGVLIAALLAGSATVANAQTEASVERELPALERLSLEELMQVEVATVGGFRQTLSEAPAAIYVISGEEIRRGGHHSLAEALRMVPGMYVGRINNSSWLLGARGLSGNALTATRYLVLVDGRTVYDPLFSGTFWDVVDLPLSDIDRIEVIRGPGPTLWGANAMNGVINVITKPAAETLGGLVRVAPGDPENVATVRYGGEVPGGGAYRVWGKYRQRDASELSIGGSAHDELTTARGGFRLDRGDVSSHLFTLQGDAYDHPETESSVRLPVPGRHQEFEQVISDGEVSGANLLFRVRHEDSAQKGWRVRAYYDHTDRQNPQIGVERDSANLAYRGWAPWGERHDLLWGFEYDWTSDSIRDSAILLFTPDERSWSFVNGYVQGTSELVAGRLFAMVGTKLTYHEFVDLELQPSARLWWTPDEHQTVWAALSRPVRVPSRLERDGALVFSYADTGQLLGGPPSGLIVPLALGGEPELDVESLLAYEVGYRRLFGARVSLDAALFYNDYADLVSVPTSVVGTWNQLGRAETYGVELSSSWRVADWWQLEGAYSWLRVQVHGPVFQFEEDSAPEHMAQLRSRLSLRHGVELNGAAYYVDRIRQGDFDAYVRLDVGLSWRLRPDLEISIRGQNLLEAAHTEASAVEVPRGGYLQLTAAF